MRPAGVPARINFMAIHHRRLRFAQFTSTIICGWWLMWLASWLPEVVPAVLVVLVVELTVMFVSR